MRVPKDVAVTQGPQPDGPSEQRADVAGRNNIVVQIVGDGNSVVIGYAHLTLTRYPRRRRIASETDLLSPYTRSIKFVGRDAELTELCRWLESDRQISVRVLIGGAGCGKTRLALELCEQMLAKGWDAGFVTTEELERFQRQQNLSQWGWQRPTLAVVDYAAVHASLLNKWLNELADYQGPAKQPLRILLLERHAESESGWWQTAFGRGGWGSRAVQQLLDPAEPIELPPLPTSERRTVIGETLKKAGSSDQPPTAGSDPEFDRRLAQLTWGGEPLFLMMAGLLAKQAAVTNVLSLGRTDLAFELADRELARLERLGGEDKSKQAMLVHMGAYSTLCRGLDENLALRAAETEAAVLGRAVAGGPAELADLLRDALPGSEGGIEPILPDVIGEATVLRAFEPLKAKAREVVLRAFEHAGVQVAATVIRIAQDFAAAGHEQPLAWFDALIDREDPKLRELTMIADAMPGASVVLAPFAVKLQEIITEDLAKLVEQRPDQFQPSYAKSLVTLAHRLSQVGRSQEALERDQEAVGIYRNLAAANAAAYEPYLAWSLEHVAGCLGELGRHEAALDPAQEAVQIWRKLVAANPDVYEPRLAVALNTLAYSSNELGRRGAALELAEQAARTLAPHFTVHPAAYGPWMLTMARHYLERCEALGRNPDAALLGPIVSTLQRLQEDQGDEADDKEGGAP